MKKSVVVSTSDPVVVPIASMRLNASGINAMAKWVESHRPDCLPDNYHDISDLFPHNGTEQIAGHGFDADGAPIPAESRVLTDNELLVELAGRKCYDSFGAKAGRKSNREYILHTQEGKHPHASIMYHAKTSWFISGLSRRVSLEMIRNYVGSDRDQEGSPSQESTRFTHHYGYYIAHPNDLSDPEELEHFRREVQSNYDGYSAYIKRKADKYAVQHGTQPKGLARKRIYEAAAGLLAQSAETSFVWTTNPVSFSKMILERSDEAADAEFQRLANVCRKAALSLDPNLYARLSE